MATHDRRVSRAQLLEAYELTTKQDLDPATFEVKEVEGDDKCLVIEFGHPPTRSFFRFDWDVRFRTGFSLKWWPSGDGTSHHQKADEWRTALIYFSGWLNLVKKENDTPDVWALAREQRAWLTTPVGTPNDNSAFAPLERELIAKSLSTIEEYTIRTFQLQEDQAAHVREQLGYLAAAAERVGRVDWKNLATATFINIVVTLALDPDKTQKLLALATNLLGPFVASVARLLS